MNSSFLIIYTTTRYSARKETIMATETILPSPLVIVRGAGDISTGTIHRLFRAGFGVLALESERPSAIRRRVAFSEAVYDGAATVEGVTAARVDGISSLHV